MENQSPRWQQRESDAPLTILQLARRHSRERLLVAPIRWTGRQLELFQCTFQGPSPVASIVNSPLPGKRGGQRIRRAVEYYDWEAPYRASAIRVLLSGYGPFDHRENLSFFFNRRLISQLKCDVFLTSDRGDTRPLAGIAAACVDLDAIKDLRSDFFAPPVRRQSCESLGMLSIINMRKSTPKNRLHDPCIVAILIAIAQENITRADAPAETRLFFTSQAIVSSENKDSIYLYRAHISSAFLRCLEQPAIAPLEPAISVRISTVPFKPYRTFRDRLAALLLPERELEQLRRIEVALLPCQSTQDRSPRHPLNLA
ncbi:hypothetical protein HIM_02294 [Hirsutella minnesotensis 3608]|nr:hypothetical protein HIM_02294 [Hirsutella minnesotensis 3608]